MRLTIICACCRRRWSHSRRAATGYKKTPCGWLWVGACLRRAQQALLELLVPLKLRVGLPDRLAECCVHFEESEARPCTAASVDRIGKSIVACVSGRVGHRAAPAFGSPSTAAVAQCPSPLRSNSPSLYFSITGRYASHHFASP